MGSGPQNMFFTRCKSKSGKSGEPRSKFIPGLKPATLNAHNSSVRSSRDTMQI